MTRNSTKVLLAVGAVVAATFALAAVATAGVVNSKHDFSSGGTGGNWGATNQAQVCIFCHTPHNAQAGQEPLWNRVALSKTFSIYSSDTFDGKSTIGQPGGNSKLCLSCHDGSVAIDAYVAGNPSTSPKMMAIGDVYYPGSPYGQGGPNIGGNYAGNNNVNDLTNDHPVSFTYDDALANADKHLKLASALPATLPLYGGKMECATCHDVHNQKSIAGTKLLRVAKDGSALCLTCHLK